MNAKKQPEVVEQVWTYACVDYDLISDDVQGALGVMPHHAYFTFEAALIAACAAHRTEFEELYESEDPAHCPAYEPLEWRLSGEDGTHEAHYNDSEVWVVYPILLVAP